MTAPGSATPDGRTPRRRAALSPLRRLSRNVLAIGTALAVLSAFGPLWAARIGLVVAVVSAVVACSAAWREVSQAHRQHAGELLAANRAHGQALREERQHNASVLDTVTTRARSAAAEARRLYGEQLRLESTVQALTGTVARLRREITTLSGQRAEAIEESRQRGEKVAALQQALRASEVQLREVTELREGTEGRGEAAGNVRALSRRVAADHSSAPDGGVEPAPAENAVVDRVWGDRRRPEVTDLVADAVVLPNYEGDRRPA